MGSYIVNFTVYTMAMCGLIFFALFVFKKFASGNFGSKNSQFLGVEDMLSLAPRKMLYVIRAGEERFLIASDADKTTLISKLEDGNISFQSETPQNQSMRQNNRQQAEQNFEEKTRFIGVDDLPVITPKLRKNKNSDTVIKNMISRVKD